MKRIPLKPIATLLFALAVGWNATAQNANTSTNLPDWITRPLSLTDTLNLALQQNATILKARSDLEASHGVVVQTRAVALPQVLATGNYTDTDPNAIDKFPITAPGFTQPHENWNTGVKIVQSIYEGGKMIAAIRAASVTK